MNGLVDSTMHMVSHRWANATPTDFGALALAIVVSAWFFSRFYCQR